MDRVHTAGQILVATPAEVIGRLPRFGRVMIISSTGAVTHERIGRVEQVSEAGGRFDASGPGHDCSLDPGGVTELVVTRSPNPAGKVFPRVDFLAGGATILFSFVGFEGPEAFDRALTGLEERPDDAVRKGLAFEARPDAAVDDPARLPFDAARAAGREARVTLERPGFRQSWCGMVPELKLSMGFVNLLVDDFHMHVAGGAVAGWRTTDGVARAFGADGGVLGLSVEMARAGPA